LVPGGSIADTTPKYHKKTGKLLMLGQRICYKGENALMPELDAVGKSYYSVYDTEKMCWNVPRVPLDQHGNPLTNTFFGCIQRIDLENGDILIPMSRRNDLSDPKRVTHVVVMRFSFDGDILRAVDQGAEIHADEEPRGLAEPSLAYYQGKYYITLRCDTKGYVAVSDDGLNYSPIKPWCWDTGIMVPTYNTQSHWVCGREGLHLVYTRKDGKNDHVFRNRAPLYMAKVDVERLCLMRNTEVAITPERGARMGNFGADDISLDESLVTTTEWMQPIGCERFGSNNAIYMIRIWWD
jgi:hypothetical protein